MYNYNVGAAEQGQYGATDDAFSSAFSAKAIRMGFIRKVYGILSVQLLITFGFVAAFSASESARKWTQQHSYLLYVALGITIVTLLVLACCGEVARKTPFNYIALMIFTLAESFLVGTISSVYEYRVVLTAVAITGVICIALTIFAFQTKIDFTIFNGLLFVLCIVLMIFGFVTMFWKAKLVLLIYSCLGALLFSAYLLVDTQMIVGGNHKLQFSEEDYVFAAITIYLDIVQLFLYILQIVASLSSNE